jgi:hypothetical protein
VKRRGAVVGAIIVGVIVFAVGTGVAAALLTAVAQTDWSPTPGVSTALGLLLDLMKFGVAIWSGYRAYKYLTQ